MCNFSIAFAGNSKPLIDKARAAIAQAGGSFNGDDAGGAFSLSTPAGKIAGRYQVAGQEVSFTITEKPFFVSCGMIEAQLKKYVDAA